MTEFVPIKPGVWVLALHQGYGPADAESMADHLERFAFRHWMDSSKADDHFFVMQVKTVMPKTYTVVGSSRYIDEGARLSRHTVVAALKSEEGAIALRNKLFSIGEEVGDRIEAEMYRRIEKFAAREQEKGLKRVKRLLPHIYGRGE